MIVNHVENVNYLEYCKNISAQELSNKYSISMWSVILSDKQFLLGSKYITIQFYFNFKEVLTKKS